MLLKGTVRSYDGGAWTAEVELVGSHGAYITVPVATHLDSRSVAAGKRCAILSFDRNDQGDAVLVATYDEAPLMGAGSVDHGLLAGLADDDHTQYLNAARHTAIGDSSPHHAAVTLGTPGGLSLAGQQLSFLLGTHDHIDAAGEGGTFDAANLNSGLSTDGYVLTADGANGAAWEALPALANHDHSGDAGDGGTLDWDNVWADAVHDHSSNAEGGVFDASPLVYSEIFTPSQFVLTGGTPTLTDFGPSDLYQGCAWLFDADAAEAVGIWFPMRATKTGSTVRVTVYYCMVSATSGAVRWGSTVRCAGDGEDCNANGNYAVADVNVPGTAKLLDSAVIDVSEAYATGDIIRITIYRAAANAADTATGDAVMLGVKVSFV